MYFADTYAGKVYVMPCDAAGTPDVKAEWRTLLTFDTHNEGAPDGVSSSEDTCPKQTKDNVDLLWLYVEANNIFLPPYYKLRSSDFAATVCACCVCAGMAIDTEGRLWVAHESGGQVRKPCMDLDCVRLLHSMDVQERGNDRLNGSTDGTLPM